jgi:hypothetical protein
MLVGKMSYYSRNYSQFAFPFDFSMKMGVERG